MSYAHFTIQQREIIAQWHFAGKSNAQIARELGCHRSSVHRELKRNSWHGKYQAQAAHHRAGRRRVDRPWTRKMDRPEVQECVRRRLVEGWSPEEIVGRQRLQEGALAAPFVSHHTIYRWLRTGSETALHFRQFLREGGRRRRRRKTDRCVVKDRVSIDQRPPEVATRTRSGDWEGDTVEGGGKRGYLFTAVDRASGYLVMAKLPNKTAAQTVSASRRAFRQVPASLRKTLTLDNGTEFASHKKISRHLGLDIYFAHPYSSWERGTNENTNGLIRQYIPKGTDILQVSHHAVALIQERLNNRPRKRLGYRTPAEVFRQATLAAAPPPSVVGCT